MGITGRIGSLEAYLSVRVHGFMALRTSMATWTTVSIRITDTTARCPPVAPSHSIISKRMRLATAAATPSQRQITTAAENTRCLGTVVVVAAVSTARA